MFVHFFIFLCVISALCHSAAVDSLIKCGIDDGPCQLKLIHNFLREINMDDEGGSRLDPYKITDVGLSIPELIEAKFIEGTVKGLKDCTFTNLKPHFQTGRATLELSCEHISVKGRYMFSSSSPALKTLLQADTISGDGNAKIKLDNVKVKMTLLYKIVDRDGEIYFIPKGKRVQLNDLQIGKATFNMDNILLGKEEASDRVNKFFNDNYPLLVTTFGKPLGDKVLRMAVGRMGEVFTSTPAKNFIKDDLRQYVTKQ